MSFFRDLLGALSLRDDPIQTATARDVGLQLDRIEELTATARRRLAEAEAGAWGQEHLVALLAELEDAQVSVCVAAQVARVVGRRHERMARLREEIRSLPEAGEDR